MRFFSTTAVAASLVSAGLALPINETFPAITTYNSTLQPSLVAQGCDSIGCFSSGDFSVIFHYAKGTVELNGAVSAVSPRHKKICSLTMMRRVKPVKPTTLNVVRRHSLTRGYHLSLGLHGISLPISGVRRRSLPPMFAMHPSV